MSVIVNSTPGFPTREPLAVLLLLYRCTTVLSAVQVLDPASMLTVRKVENVSTGANNKPRLTIVIQECGEL